MELNDNVSRFKSTGHLSVSRLEASYQLSPLHHLQQGPPVDPAVTWQMRHDRKPGLRGLLCRSMLWGKPVRGVTLGGTDLTS